MCSWQGLDLIPARHFFAALPWQPLGNQERILLLIPKAVTSQPRAAPLKPTQHIPEENAKSSAFPCSLPVLPSPCPVAVATGARRARPRSCGRAGWQHGVTPKVRAGAPMGAVFSSPSPPHCHQLPQRSSQIPIPCPGWEKSAPCGFEQAEPSQISRAKRGSLAGGEGREQHMLTLFSLFSLLFFLLYPTGGISPSCAEAHLLWDKPGSENVPLPLRPRQAGN